MTPEKVVFDTNLYVGFMAHGHHEDWMLRPGLARYLSAVVLMELRVGAKMLPARRAVDRLLRAYAGAGRMVAPTIASYDRAGGVLRTLRERGLETRRASLVNDVLIALDARALGAKLVTCDRDHEVIAEVVDVRVELVAAP